MWKLSEVLRVYWTILKYLGLQPHLLSRKGKIRAIFYFSITIVINTILYIIELIRTEDAAARINGFMTFPGVVVALYEIVNFTRKSKEVEKISNELDKLFIKINDGQKFSSLANRFFAIYVIINTFLLTLITFGAIVVYWTTGESLLLIYTPFKRGFGFFILWLLQTSYIVFTDFTHISTDAIMISLLFSLNFYLKALRKNLKTKKIHEIRESVQMVREIKSLLLGFEDSFAIIISLRAINTFFSMSSIVIGTIDSDSSNFIATILLYGTNIILEIYTPCYLCNEIEHDWSELLTDFYTIDWISGNSKEKKNFLIVQENLKSKFHIRAAKLFPINLPSFLVIIKSAYSLYAVLRSI